MYDLSSRVVGSMIWYSSSMPSVSDGGFIAPPPGTSALAILRQRCTHRTLPRRVVHLPAEHNALPAVLIIGLEHQAIALGQDERDEIHLAAAMQGLLLGHGAGPGYMGVDRPTLDDRKQLGVPLIAQHGETRLLVKDLAPKRVHHAHRAGPHGADHRMVAAAASHQLGEEHALVDQVHRRAAQQERAVAQLRFAWIADHHVEAVSAKVFREQNELAVRRHLAPIEDPDAWCGAAPAPLAVGLVQRVEHPMARRYRAHIEATQKLPHDGKGEKHLR